MSGRKTKSLIRHQFLKHGSKFLKHLFNSYNTSFVCLATLVTCSIAVKDIQNTNEYKRDGTVIKFHNSKSILDAEGLVMNHMFWIDATINK